jgi:regulator of replication initiation timing
MPKGRVLSLPFLQMQLWRKNMLSTIEENDIFSMGNEEIKKQLEMIDKIPEAQLRTALKMSQSSYMLNLGKIEKLNDDNIKIVDGFLQKIEALEEKIEDYRCKMCDIFDLRF